MGLDLLDEDREGYNLWAVVNTLIISGFHKIRGIVTSCGNIRFSKMNLLQGVSYVLIRASTSDRTAIIPAPQ